MKKLYVFKKMASMALAFIIGLSAIPFYSYALDETNYEQISEYKLDSYELEIPTSDLIDDGFTGILYYDDSTESIEVYTGEDFSTLDAIAVGSLTVRLSFSITHNRYYLSWEIHYPQLTYFSADLYCRDTSLFFPTYYVNTSESQSYTGANSLGYGQSYTYFSIPSSIDKVRVGWTDEYISSVTNSFYVQDGNSVVNPANVRP